MNLREWAIARGIHPQTAYRWFREGKMPVPARRLPSGTIWVDGPAPATAGKDVLCVWFDDDGPQLRVESPELGALEPVDSSAVLGEDWSELGYEARLVRAVGDRRISSVSVSTREGYAALLRIIGATDTPASPSESE